MESRVEEAVARHKKGYNCSQAVVCTYCDLFGVDEATMFKATEGLGLGLGGMQGTCGSLVGACVLAGLKNSSCNLETPDSKGQTYKISKELFNAFEEMNKFTICKDLKGIETGVMVRSCRDCVIDAAKIVEDILLKDM